MQGSSSWEKDHERRIYRRTTSLLGEPFTISANNVRRERTGLHARVGLFFGKRYLGYDEFNVGRRVERASLAKHAFSLLGEVGKEALPLDKLGEALDGFCLELDDIFSQRFTGALVAGLRRDRTRMFLCRPYVMADAGTILFAPPGTGKSWNALLMSLSIAYGIQSIWSTIKVPVLFVNLERSEESMRDRIAQAGCALGINSPELWMVNARGQSLVDVHSAVLDAIRESGAKVVVLDSISRVGLGSLKEDDVGNKAMDMLNALKVAWLAVAHAPRGEADHIFGSQMFDAAADMIVKLSAESRPDVLGLCLEVTKANDVGKPPKQFLALEFSGDYDQSELKSVRTARAGEFPELIASVKTSLSQDVLAYLESAAKADATEIANETGHNRAKVSTFLSKSPQIVRLGKVGHRVEYGLRADPIASG